ncbi:MAG: YggT family protein [Candidatus Omnitrophota bacterium]
MFIVSNFLAAIVQVVNLVFSVLYWLIIIRALLSWVSPDPFNPIVQFLRMVTEPILAPIRRFLPFSHNFGLDLSPWIAVLALVFLQSFLVRTLFDLSFRLR